MASCACNVRAARVARALKSAVAEGIEVGVVVTVSVGEGVRVAVRVLVAVAVAMTESFGVSPDASGPLVTVEVRGVRLSSAVGMGVRVTVRVATEKGVVLATGACCDGRAGVTADGRI
jgi:hypothetical protein